MGWFSDFLGLFKPSIVKVAPVIVKDEVGIIPNIPVCGLNLIKSFENCKLSAYQDQAGIWTIAYGHTQGVKEGDTCAQAQADAWLASDCSNAWAAIQRNVKVPLTQNQSGALLSLTFNIGVGEFEKSSLLTLLNSGNVSAIPNKIKQFIYFTRPDGSRAISQGLVKRRKAEALLFVGGDWRQA